MEAKLYAPMGARVLGAFIVYVLGADLHSERAPRRWLAQTRGGRERKVIFISLDRDGISLAIWYLYYQRCCRHCCRRRRWLFDRDMTNGMSGTTGRRGEESRAE